MPTYYVVTVWMNSQNRLSENIVLSVGEGRNVTELIKNLK